MEFLTRADKCRQWRLEHRESENERARKYRETHREEIRERYDRMATKKLREKTWQKFLRRNQCSTR